MDKTELIEVLVKVCYSASWMTDLTEEEHMVLNAATGQEVAEIAYQCNLNFGRLLINAEEIIETRNERVGRRILHDLKELKADLMSPLPRVHPNDKQQLVDSKVAESRILYETIEEVLDPVKSKEKALEKDFLKEIQRHQDTYESNTIADGITHEVNIPIIDQTPNLAAREFTSELAKSKLYDDDMSPSLHRDANITSNHVTLPEIHVTPLNALSDIPAILSPASEQDMIALGMYDTAFGRTLYNNLKMQNRTETPKLQVVTNKVINETLISEDMRDVSVTPLKAGTPKLFEAGSDTPVRAHSLSSLLESNEPKIVSGIATDHLRSNLAPIRALSLPKLSFEAPEIDYSKTEIISSPTINIVKNLDEGKSLSKTSLDFGPRYSQRQLIFEQAYGEALQKNIIKPKKRVKRRPRRQLVTSEPIPLDDFLELNENRVRSKHKTKKRQPIPVCTVVRMMNDLNIFADMDEYLKNPQHGGEEMYCENELISTSIRDESSIKPQLNLDELISIPMYEQHRPEVQKQLQLRPFDEMPKAFEKDTFVTKRPRIDESDVVDYLPLASKPKDQITLLVDNQKEQTPRNIDSAAASYKTRRSSHFFPLKPQNPKLSMDDFMYAELREQSRNTPQIQLANIDGAGTSHRDVTDPSIDNNPEMAQIGDFEQSITQHRLPVKKPSFRKSWEMGEDIVYFLGHNNKLHKISEVAMQTFGLYMQIYFIMQDRNQWTMTTDELLPLVNLIESVSNRMKEMRLWDLVERDFVHAKLSDDEEHILEVTIPGHENRSDNNQNVQSSSKSTTAKKC